MSKIKPGTVVIVPNGMAGTVWFISKDVAVILSNGDIWYGFLDEVRTPKSQEELDACPKSMPKAWKSYSAED